jgi:hypothetical protein
MFIERRSVGSVLLAVVMLTALAAPARAQEDLTKESAATLKTAVIADLETMKGKFIGLANAFPQDKYTWRPMEGVRSVAEVLMLAAMEGYSFVPGSFGGRAADLGGADAAAKLRTLTDKTQILQHLEKGFAHAKASLEALDPAAMTGRRQVMGQRMTAAQIALAINGDMHEHLGQLIAYARMNRIVPPWSK